MTIKNTLFKLLAIFMVTIMIAIPLTEINSHTYTTGVSSDYHTFNCINDDYYSSGYEFIELEDY